MTADSWEPCHPPPDFDYANGAEGDFFAELSPDGRTLRYASFLNSGFLQPNGEIGAGFHLIGIDSGGDLYFAGSEGDFPTIMRYRPIARPQTSLACVANATHGYEAAVSPLELVRLRGNNISGGQSASPSLIAGGMLPSSYNGLQVYFDNVAAPLLAITPDEITAFASYGVPTSGTTSVRIVVNGIVTSELNMPAEPAAPAIITVNGSAFGAAAAFNQDGSANSQTNPAAVGSIVSVFLTGLGRTSPTFPDGTIASRPGFLEGSAELSLYNAPAQILYAGPAPGLWVGVYQINFVVPVTGISDWVPLSLQVATQNAQSQPGNANVGIYVSCEPGKSCREWP
jgi:uncharacterized protein (TIGR03437 family)